MDRQWQFLLWWVRFDILTCLFGVIDVGCVEIEKCVGGYVMLAIHVSSYTRCTWHRFVCKTKNYFQRFHTDPADFQGPKRDAPPKVMPKPVYATADELAEAVKKLEGQVWLQVMSEGLIRLASGWITNSIAVVIGVYVCIIRQNLVWPKYYLLFSAANPIGAHPKTIPIPWGRFVQGVAIAKPIGARAHPTLGCPFASAMYQNLFVTHIYVVFFSWCMYKDYYGHSCTFGSCLWRCSWKRQKPSWVQHWSTLAVLWAPMLCFPAICSTREQGKITDQGIIPKRSIGKRNLNYFESLLLWWGCIRKKLILIVIFPQFHIKGGRSHGHFDQIHTSIWSHSDCFGKKNPGACSS